MWTFWEPWFCLWQFAFWALKIRSIWRSPKISFHVQHQLNQSHQLRSPRFHYLNNRIGCGWGTGYHPSWGIIPLHQWTWGTKETSYLLPKYNGGISSRHSSLNREKMENGVRWHSRGPHTPVPKLWGGNQQNQLLSSLLTSADSGWLAVFWPCLWVVGRIHLHSFASVG